MSEQPKCKLCGEPMPEGEEMFHYHGYSGPCPEAPSSRPVSPPSELIARPEESGSMSADHSPTPAPQPTTPCGFRALMGEVHVCAFPKGHSGDLHRADYQASTVWFRSDVSSWFAANTPANLGVCHRCGNEIPHFVTPRGDTIGTSGFYYVRSEAWERFARGNGELYVCDACMWADPLYIAEYGGRTPLSPAAPQEGTTPPTWSEVSMGYFVFVEHGSGRILGSVREGYRGLTTACVERTPVQPLGEFVDVRCAQDAVERAVAASITLSQPDSSLRASEPLRPFDRVTVSDGNVEDWAGIILGDAETKDWYWFVPLVREHSPRLWPIRDGWLRFPRTDITLVKRWEPYPPDAPYSPEHQIWLNWMGELIDELEGEEMIDE